MYKQADRIFETADCAGSAPVTLLGAFNGLYKTFASFMAEGDTTTILIESTVANEAEVCEATLTAGQLIRGSVLWSTNVDNSQVLFVPGTKRVMMSETVEHTITVGPDGVVTRDTLEMKYSKARWGSFQSVGSDGGGVDFGRNDAPLDKKNWQVYAQVDGTLKIIANSDDWTVEQSAWSFDRDGSVVMNAPVSPASGWVPWTQSIAGRELATLGVYTDSNPDSWHAELATYAYATAAYGSGLNMAMARGTVLAPLPVQDNDNVAFIYARAWDGAFWRGMSELDWFVDGTPGAGGTMPTRVRMTMSGGLIGTWSGFDFRASGDSYFGKGDMLHLDPASGGAHIETPYPLPPDLFPGYYLKFIGGNSLLDFYAWNRATEPGTAMVEMDVRAFLGAGTAVSSNYGFGIWAPAWRGTSAAPAPVGDGDDLLWFQAGGYDGTQVRSGPIIDFSVEGTPGVGGHLMPIVVALKMLGAAGWDPFEAAWIAHPDGNSYFGKGGAIHVDAAGAVWIIDSSNLTAPWFDIVTTTEPGMSWQATANGVDQKNWMMLVGLSGAMRLGAWTDGWTEQEAFVFGRDGSFTTSGPITAEALHASAAVNPAFSWDHTGNAVDLRKWDFFEWSDGNIYIRALTDVGVTQNQFEFSRDGVFHAPFMQTTTLAPGNNTTLAATTAFVMAAIAAAGGGGGGAPSGPAGGVLGGTYPNPGFAASPAFTGDLTATGAIQAGTYVRGTQMQVNASLAQYEWFSTSAVADARRWDVTGWTDGRLYVRSTTDAGAVQAQASFGRDASLTLSGGMSAANLQIAGHVIAYSPLAGFTGLANYGDGAINIFLGGSGDPHNYYRNNNHSLQNLDASITYVTMGPSGASWGIPVAGQTAAPGTNSTLFSTTAFVAAAVAAAIVGFAPLAAPAFTGNPTAPTAAVGDSDTSLATTGFVQQELGYLGQTIQAGNYTTVQGDAGGSVYHASGAGAALYTIPNNTTLPYVIGTTITFVNDSATAITIAVQSTDTMALSPAGTTGTRTLAQNGVATAYKATSTRWLISGTGLT